VGPLKKNRTFEGKPLKAFRRHPYWHAVGSLTGGISVVVVRHRRPYYATTRLSLTAHEVRRVDKMRHEVEEVITTWKDQWRLEACQAGYRRAPAREYQEREGVQEHHLALCVIASLVLERERIDRGLTFHQLRRELIVKGLKVPVASLKRLRTAA
jgi:hypothetical protein